MMRYLLMFFAGILPMVVSAARISWDAIGPGVSGACFGVAFNPQNPRDMSFGTDMGALFITENGGKWWKIAGSEKAGGNPGYRGCWNILYDPVNPRIIWVASEHGVYKSEDGGETWRRTTAGIGGTNFCFQGLALDPSDSNIIYTCEGWSPGAFKAWITGRLWRSTDGGETWQQLASPAGNKPGTLFSHIMIDPAGPHQDGLHQEIYVCGKAGFFKSADGGKSWNDLRPVLPLPDGVSVEFGNMHCIQGGELLVTVIPGMTKDKPYGGIYRSMDGGKNWEHTEFNRIAESVIANVAGLNEKSVYLKFSVFINGSRKYPDRLYAAVHPGGVFRSDDRGKTWINTHQSNTKWFPVKLQDGRTTHFRSSKKGGNFKNSQAYGTDGMHQLAVCDGDPDFVAYTDMGSMVLSRDGGKTWSDPIIDYIEPYDEGRFGAELPTVLTHAVKSRGPQFIVCSQVGKDPFDGNILYAAYMDHGLRVSRDGGISWEMPSRGLETYHDVNGARSFTVDPEVKGKVYFTSCKPVGRAFVSNDFGRSFRNISLPQNFATDALCKAGHSGIVIDPSSPKDLRRLYMTSDNGLFKSENDGKTWQDFTPDAIRKSRLVRILKLSPGNPAIMFLGSDPQRQQRTAGFFVSHDAGKAWRQILPDKIGGVWDIAIAPSNPRIIFLIANSPNEFSSWKNTTLWKSTDGGDSWIPVLKDGFYHALAVHPVNPDIIYTACKIYDLNQGKPVYLKSVDGGKSWTSIADQIPIVGALQSITIDPKDPRQVFFCDWFTIYRGFDPEN